MSSEFKKHIQKNEKSKFYFLMIALPFISLISATLFLWKQELNRAEDRLNYEFQSHTQNTIEQIKLRMNTYRDVLKSTQGLFKISTPTRDQFATFIDTLSVHELYPGIQGIGFTILIPRSEIKSHENKVKKEGFSTYEIRPAGNRDIYTSIIYLEPFKEKNLKAFGFDMFSEPTRAEAMKESAITGEPVLSGKVTLIQEPLEGAQSGFLMYLPVYKKKNQINIQKLNLNDLVGWVYAPFRADDFMQGILGHNTLNLNIEIFDGTTSSKENLLHKSNNFSLEDLFISHYQTQETITLFDRKWTVKISSLPNFEAKLDRSSADKIAFFGSALSILLTYLIWHISSSRQRAIKQVRLRTKELSELNQFSAWIHGIDNVLMNAKTYEECISEILNLLTQESRWCIAGFWQISSENSELELFKMQSKFPEKHQDFIQLSSSCNFKYGEGLPGRILEIKQLSWIPELAKDLNFPRRSVAQKCGLICGLAFQVKTADNILGVIELFTEDYVDPTNAFSQELTSVGLRIGHRLMSLKLENQLQNEQARIRQLMTAINASAIVSEADSSGKITSVNLKFCEISGYTEAELLGEDHRKVSSGLESKQFFKDMWSTISSGKTWVGEIRNRTKFGEIYIVASVITPIQRADGTIESYLSVRFDLTPQKKYHQQLIEAQEISKIGSWHLDLNSNTQIWSHMYYHIFELPEYYQPEQLQQSHRKLIHPEDLPKFDHLLERAKLFGENFIFEHRVLFDKGIRIKYVQIIAKVSKNQAGDPILINGTCQDITDRIQQTHELEIERSKAQHSAKLATLGELAAGIAHEINNPMAIIAGNIPLFKKFKDNSDIFESKISASLKACERVSKIVNGLRKFSRSHESAPYRVETLSNIIVETLVMIETKAKFNSVLIETQFESFAKILCDENEIEQVLINLVNNAIDAISALPEKWIKINLFEDQNELVLQIVDSGSGISPEIENKLFHPFFTTKPVGEGTGLGLSITKGILDQHKASLKLNRQMKNTCFEIRFPIAREMKIAN